MYTRASAAAVAAAGGSTPFLGLGVGWDIVLIVTIGCAAFAALRLVPKRRKGRRS